MNDAIYMSTLDVNEQGVREINVKVIKHSDIEKCPSYILWPPHWRADGTCRHDEPLCENDGGCENLKTGEEIFCAKHLEEMM